MVGNQAEFDLRLPVSRSELFIFILALGINEIQALGIRDGGAALDL